MSRPNLATIGAVVSGSAGPAQTAAIRRMEPLLHMPDVQEMARFIKEAVRTLHDSRPNGGNKRLADSERVVLALRIANCSSVIKSALNGTLQLVESGTERPTIEPSTILALGEIMDDPDRNIRRSAAMAIVDLHEAEISLPILSVLSKATSVLNSR